jgi:hypothetical protein
LGSAEWVAVCVPKIVEKKAERVVFKRSCTDDANLEFVSAGGFQRVVGRHIGDGDLLFEFLSLIILLGNQQDGFKGGDSCGDAKPVLRESDRVRQISCRVPSAMMRASFDSSFLRLKSE